MDLPTIEDVNEQRVARFNQRISAALAAGEADAFRGLIERYEREHNVPAVEIAAALASIAQGKTPLLLDVGGEPQRTQTRPETEAIAQAADEEQGRTERTRAKHAQNARRRPGSEAQAQPTTSRPTQGARTQNDSRPQSAA